MKNPLPSKIEDCRIDGPPHTSVGACQLKRGNAHLRVVFSDGRGWDHVSVSLATRCPTWGEMEYVRRLFFKADETVMQLHVPTTDHINQHDFCLHLWRPQSDLEIARVRQEWGTKWVYGDLPSAGEIPRPLGNMV